MYRGVLLICGFNVVVPRIENPGAGLRRESRELMACIELYSNRLSDLALIERSFMGIDFNSTSRRIGI